MGISIAGTIKYLWESGELSWKLHNTQKLIDSQVRNNPARDILILSCRQLGKSYWATNYAISYCLQNPGSIVRVCAPTLKQVNDIVEDNLAHIIQDAPEGLIERHKSSYRWTIGTSSLRLGALERAHVDANRGGKANLIICEEGGFIPSDDYHYALKSVLNPQRLRTKAKMIHVTTPSEEIDHYIHTHIKPETELSNSFFNFTIFDNPQLTESDINEAIRVCGGTNTIEWQREYLAKIVRNHETVIVPTFSKELHIHDFTTPERYFPVTVIDWGGVRDKTVALLFTYDYLRNKRLWMDERVFEPNTSTEEIVKTILEMESTHPPTQRYADVPGQLQVDLMATHNFEVVLPHKDDWRSAINNLQVSIGRMEHEIHPRCKFLISSLENGRFNKTRTDFDRTKALGHCDALAAMMYGHRMTLTDNPYPYIVPSMDNMMIVSKHKTELEKVAESFQHKVFSPSYDDGFYIPKKFGGFKK